MQSAQEGVVVGHVVARDRVGHPRLVLEEVNAATRGKARTDHDLRYVGGTKQVVKAQDDGRMLLEGQGRFGAALHVSHGLGAGTHVGQHSCRVLRLSKGWAC